METILEQKLNIDKSTWQKVKFGDVVKEPKESIKDPVSSGVEHVIGLEHIIPEEIHLRKWNTLEDGKTFTKAFNKGDVLFGRRRAYLKKAALAPFPGICSGDITVFRAKENLLPELLPFIVNNDKFFDYAVKHSAGGLSPRVKFKDLANYEFLLPPKDQQAGFAELLWAMDEVVQKGKKMLIFSNIAKKTIIKTYFKKESVVKRIDELGTVVTGNTPSTKVEEYWGGSTPFISPSDIDDSPFVNQTERYLTDIGKNKSRIFPANSILTVCIGSTIGKVAINKIESCSNQQINALIPKHNYQPIYLLYLLRFHKSKIMARTGSTAVPIINKSEFSSIKLPLLNSDERIEFVDKLEACDRSLSKIKQQIKCSKSLQKSLINQIF